MKKPHNYRIVILITSLCLWHTFSYSQLPASTSLPRLSPQLLNYGGSYHEFQPSSGTKCQLAFGWYINQRYAHWISSRHDAGTTYRNALDFYMWEPGNSSSALGTNHVMSITGRGLAVGDIFTVPAGFIMKVSGNVSIDGNIECEKVEVKNVAADFVFDKSYSLPTLSEVKQYIDANNHLPGIPPASETIQGVDLGELTQTLLQKIEELTLYTIDQDERIKELQSQLNSLNK